MIARALAPTFVAICVAPYAHAQHWQVVSSRILADGATITYSIDANVRTRAGTVSTSVLEEYSRPQRPFRGRRFYDARVIGVVIDCGELSAKIHGHDYYSRGRHVLRETVDAEIPYPQPQNRVWYDIVTAACGARQE